VAFRILEFLSVFACCILCALPAAVCVCAKLRALLGRAPVPASGPVAAPDGTEESAPAGPGRSIRLSLSLAACAALAAFLWIPFGSLPALLPAPWGGLALLGCLALTPGFAEGRLRDSATRNKARVLLLLGLCLALCAWYARQRSLPGYPFSLDGYVAVPLAGLMGWQERLGMLLPAAALLLALRDVQHDLASGLAQVPRLEAGEARAAVVTALTRQIWIFAVLGAAVCLFVPFCPATRLGMSGATGLAVDLLVFWLKVLLADHALWAARNAFPRFSTRPSWAHASLAGLGTLCLLSA